MANTTKPTSKNQTSQSQDLLKDNIDHRPYGRFWQDERNAKVGIPKARDYLDDGHKRIGRASEKITKTAQDMSDRADLLMRAASEHIHHHNKTLHKNSERLNQHLQNIQASWHQFTNPTQLLQAWYTYVSDSATRALQTADVLRERGDIFLEHESAGCPPVLDYDYEVMIDGATLPRPSNYVLLKILPPEGVEISDERRPYIIIDPRAGHGGGIGGFKHDSQVGVAFKDGHPVYFVAFKRMPESGQTLADVTYAEAVFVRAVRKLHPKANPPVVVGNCQGGWAALILAATNPDITGPIVLNGSPVSAWGGAVGVNPMRYKGGVQGSTWVAMLTSDLGNGVFDGSWLVQNFEMLNPARNWVGKYYDLYKNPLNNKDRFLEFERWWGGFFMMNEEEIRWIVENIFVGNKISRNTAQLEAGTHIDIKNVKAPIIVFASHGDNITPPQQALNWILDTYTDEREIEVCGQRIVYMVHEQVGHLGIFVSSSIANREHKGVASILKMIEALPPGLYELVLEDYEGKGEDMKFYVTFQHRTSKDIEALNDGRLDEKPFKALARVSQTQANYYDTFIRPTIRAMSNESTAQWLRVMHPMRLQRSLWSSKNPVANLVKNLSQATAKQREETYVAAPNDSQTEVQKQQKTLQGIYASATLPAIEPLRQDNPFLLMEKLYMDTINMALNQMTAWQSMMQEMMFFGIWAMPWMRNYGQKEYSRRLLKSDDIEKLPAVEKALSQIEQGGFIEAVIRMLIITKMMTQSGIDKDKLMLITEILTQSEPFTTLNHKQLAEILHQQTIIVRFDKTKAIQTLPNLLKTKAERELASKAVRYVAGKHDDMPLDTRQALTHIHDALSLKNVDDDITSNPLKKSDKVVRG